MGSAEVWGPRPYLKLLLRIEQRLVTSEAESGVFGFILHLILQNFELVTS